MSSWTVFVIALVVLAFTAGRGWITLLAAIGWVFNLFTPRDYTAEAEETRKQLGYWPD